jgi:pimeloyl-ACP methyl ester carboxylesterase
VIRRRAWLLLGAVLLAYGGLCAWMSANQRALVYYPQFTRVAAAGTDFALTRDDGTTLRGWRLHPGARRAVVYFGGNGEDVGANRAVFARALPDHAVYLLAYRGYGASDGEPSQPALLADALAIYDEAQRRHPAAPPAVIGRSLGSGVASYVAWRRPVDRLVLVTPFDSLAAVAQEHYPWLPVRWLLRERYPSAAWLRAYRARWLVVRAGRDTVVPPARTDALIAAVPQPPEVVAMPDAGHNALDEAMYAKALTEFLSR